MRYLHGLESRILLHLPRKNDPDHFRMFTFDFSQQLHSIYLRHSQIRNDNIKRSGAKKFQCLFTAGSKRHFPDITHFSESALKTL